MVSPFRDTLTLVVSADDTPFTRDQTVANPGGSPVIELPTRSVGVTDGVGYEHGFLGTIDTARLSGMVINTVASREADNLLTREVIDALVLDGVDVFETMLALALNNRQQPRSRFSL